MNPTTPNAEKSNGSAAGKGTAVSETIEGVPNITSNVVADTSPPGIKSN